MKRLLKDLLTAEVFNSRSEMGAAAARDISAKVTELLKEKDELNLIFAAAPSQNEVLAALVADRSVPWERINAYHMDEYVGLDPNAPQRFGNFLQERLFSLVPLKSVNLIDATTTDPDGEAERYGKTIDDHPADIVILGIGENGHIAFNDPPVADFNDPKTVKTVKLDEICRQQQVNDGCFERLSLVPTHAITLTIPALTRAPWLFCVVPAKSKAEAVKNTLQGQIGEHCPATILRRHGGAKLYLDPDSAALI